MKKPFPNIITKVYIGIVNSIILLAFITFWKRVHIYIVVGVMTMGNIVPRVGFEPTYRAFHASVLPLHHVDFPDVTTIPMPTSI